MPIPTAYDGDDFYCDVALRETHLLDVVHESEAVLAYHHTRPYWPIHVVVVPKAHVPSLTDLAGADDTVLLELFAVVRETAATIEREQGAAAVLTNLGRYQDSKHLHVHVSSGEPLR
jgi:histidine triad (HIT) family protein